jgi:outer membrane lipoprotein-sorting protein
MLSIRKRTILLCLTIVLAGALAAPAAEDLTLEHVLDKYYQAMGGKEAWAAVDSMHQKATMQMMGMEAPMEMWSKRPHKLRVEFTMQGMTGIQAIDGESGWMVMPFMGSTDPEPMPEDMLKAMSSDVDIDGPLFGWQEKGHRVELLGQEEIQGTQAYKLGVEMASGTEMTIYLDAEYFVPIVMKSKVSMQGQEMETTSTISDYKEVDGLMIAHSVQAESPMGVQSITIQEVEINPEIDDARFAMPVAAAAPPQG